MKGKAGRPRIPFSTISNRKADGLTGAPDDTASMAPKAAMARGGSPKKRLDKKMRGVKRADGGKVPDKKNDDAGDTGEPDTMPDKKASGGHVKKWEQKAVKHPGVEKKAAARAGMTTHEYMEKHKHDSGTAGKRARLGLTFEKQAAEHKK